MTQHNGEYGCVFCEQPGIVVTKGKGNCRAYPYGETPAPKRTHDSVLKTAVKAAQTGKKVQGMLCRNVFICLTYLSLGGGGWSGGAMVPGRPTILITVGQGPTALAVGAGGVGLDIFTLICPFSTFSLPSGDGPI